MQPDGGMVPLLKAAGFMPIGALRPPRLARSAPRLGASAARRWIVEYVDYTQTIPHLGELGATQARLQGGWAKCDPGNGSYNWRWLD